MNYLANLPNELGNNSLLGQKNYMDYYSTEKPNYAMDVSSEKGQKGNKNNETLDSMMMTIGNILPYLMKSKPVLPFVGGANVGGRPAMQVPWLQQQAGGQLFRSRLASLLGGR